MNRDLAPGYVVSHSRDFLALDLPVIAMWLRKAYWAHWQTPKQIDRALLNGIVIGAYRISPAGTNAFLSREMIAGFARVISDHATNSMVTDLYVDEPHRRRGVGRMLMQAVTQHDSVRPTLCILGCRAHLRHFYNEFGFTGVGGDFMVRNPTP